MIKTLLIMKDYLNAIIAGIIVLGSLGLVLWSIPVRNQVKDNEIVVRFALGSRMKFDLSEVIFKPVPESATRNLIRTNGTSLGKIQSGHFKNTKTGDKFLFYFTGKGQKVCFELDGKTYIVDLSEDDVAILREKYQGQ